MTEQTPSPIVCDMTGAPDSPEERLRTYRRLYADALVGSERSDGTIRFRFRAAAGIEQRVRDVAALEAACCAFIEHTIIAHDSEIWWEARTIDDPVAHQILDAFYRLPDTTGDGVGGLYDRFVQEGLVIVTGENGTLGPA